MLSQRRRGKGVLQGCELGTCVSAFRERARKKEDFKNMCTCNCVHAFVCACAKAWKAASQTVISKTMCQLTEGTHAPLYSGLSSGPALCLFFLQWTGSSVYNSHPKPSLWNILPATAARRAKAALTSPNPPPVFAQSAEYPPTFFTWSRFSGDKRSCKLIWNACKFFSFHVPNPSACDGSAARGGCEERGLFSSLRFMLKAENSLYPPTLCRPPYLQGIESGSH